MFEIFNRSKSDIFDYKKFIKQMKKEDKGLMTKKQYMEIAKKLSDVSPCNLLVFGLGEDSYLWDKINAAGTTIFLEDSKEWIAQFTESGLDIEHVEYATSVKDFKEINFDESKLQLELSDRVKSTEWNFIIVDAPLGHQPPREFKGPGRMASIYNAHKLLSKGGTAVVDDMGREVERVYAHHYFGTKNMISFIQDKVGIFIKN